MFNIKKLFQSKKLKMQIPLNTLYGYKYLFHVVNLALFCIVIILSIVSASIYFLMPVIDISELSGKVDIQEAEKMLYDQEVDETLHGIGFPDTGSSEEDRYAETYTIISEKNVFSPQRKEWVVKKMMPRPDKSVKKKLAKKKAVIGKLKKIVLHGVVIAGDMRKALINNPMKGVRKKKYMYVEEGEELEGYRVTSIESDLIRLDWQGEEIVVTLYSGLNDYEQANNVRDEEGDISKVEFKNKEIEGQRTVGRVDIVDRGMENLFAGINHKDPFNHMSHTIKHTGERDRKTRNSFVGINRRDPFNLESHTIKHTDERDRKTENSSVGINRKDPFNLMSTGLQGSETFTGINREDPFNLMSMGLQGSEGE